MPRQPRQPSDSGIHHVMLRGINRQDIFLDDDDYRRFLWCLDVARELSGCRVLAYCLMTNHVHLVIQTGTEPIGRVVKRLGIRYAYWHNTKYNRVGHLFQDRFKSRPVDDDSYLVTLLRYVWNNPVQAGLIGRPELYRWSSLRPNRIVDQDVLQALVEPTTLAQLAAIPLFDIDDPGQPPNAMTDAEAAELIVQVCRKQGKGSASELSRSEQRRVFVRALHRGASVRQLARVARMDRKAIRRVTSALPTDGDGGSSAVASDPGDDSVSAWTG